MKIFLNSVISDAWKGTSFVSVDITDHYLQSSIHSYHYMRVSLKYVTTEIHREYDIMNIVEKGYVYIKIRKRMYGIKEAGIFNFNYMNKF